MAFQDTASGQDSIAIKGTATGDNSIGVNGTGETMGVYGSGGTWHGVVGMSRSTLGGAGVYGFGDSGSGVRGETRTAYNAGVHGIHSGTMGPGVSGEAENGAGVSGSGKTWVGVYGETHAPVAIGSAGVLGDGKEGGVGVKGVTAAPDVAALVGYHSAMSGAGLYAKGAPAAFFDGDVIVTERLTVQGRALDELFVKVDLLVAQMNKLSFELSEVLQRVAVAEVEVARTRLAAQHADPCRGYATLGDLSGAIASLPLPQG